MLHFAHGADGLTTPSGCADAGSRIMNSRSAPVPDRDANASSSAHHKVSRAFSSATLPPPEMPAERGALAVPTRLDDWIVPPDTADQRKRGRGSARRTETMAQQLTDLVEQFCNFQQRGKTEGGVRTYRWILEQFLIFVRNRYGRLARVTDLTSPTIQEWMDDMAGADLALSTMRVRQSTLSSFCAWLVKRDGLAANPVAKLERPPHHREPPKQIPGASIMDALVEAAKARRRPRDVAIFLILRYTGMRRESVATLRVQHLDGTWGLRGVRVKGGKTRDIPLPRRSCSSCRRMLNGCSASRSRTSARRSHCSGPPGAGAASARHARR